jgi:hypothetical protein
MLVSLSSIDEQQQYCWLKRKLLVWLISNIRLAKVQHIHIACQTRMDTHGVSEITKEGGHCWLAAASFGSKGHWFCIHTGAVLNFHLVTRFQIEHFASKSYASFFVQTNPTTLDLSLRRVHLRVRLLLIFAHQSLHFCKTYSLHIHTNDTRWLASNVTRSTRDPSTSNR